MKRLSFLKKLQLFLSYKRVIKGSKDELLNTFNLRIDYADRLYTVLNIPEETFGEAYVFKKNEIEKVAEAYIKEYINAVGKNLSTKGLNELFRIYKIERVDKLSYLVVIGYSLFRSNVFYNNLYYKFIPFLLVTSTITYFLLK